MKLIYDSHWKSKYGKIAAGFPDDVVPMGGSFSQVPPPQPRHRPLVRGSTSCVLGRNIRISIRKSATTIRIPWTQCCETWPHRCVLTHQLTHQHHRHFLHHFSFSILFHMSTEQESYRQISSRTRIDEGIFFIFFLSFFYFVSFIFFFRIFLSVSI